MRWDQRLNLSCRLRNSATSRPVPKSASPVNEQDSTRWLEVCDLDQQESIPALKGLLEGDSPDLRKEAAEAPRRMEARTRPTHGERRTAQ